MLKKLRRLPILIVATLVLSSNRLGALPSRADEETKAAPLTPAQVAALIGGPTPITLHLENALPQAFFQELWKQAGLTPVNGYPASNAKEPLFSLQSEQQPFWSVIREFAKQTKLSVYEVGASSDRIMLTPATGARGLDGLAVENQPFLITLSNIERSQKHSVQLGSDAAVQPQEDRLRLRFSIFSDPKLPLIPYATTITVEKAATDNGASLIGAQPLVSPILSNARFTLESALLLAPPAAGATKIVRLKGYVSTFVATKTETWELDDIAQAEGQSRGTLPEPLSVANVRANPVAKYVVTKIALTDKGYALELSYTRSITALENRSLSAAIFSDIRFVDDKGADLLVQSSGGRGQFGMSDARNEVLQGYTQRIQAIRGASNSAAGPVKMIWKIPTEFQEVRIPFEFSDLPLP